MRVLLESDRKTDTSERVTITFEFNPSDKTQEGMVAMVMAVADCVRQIVFLQKVVEAPEEGA